MSWLLGDSGLIGAILGALASIVSAWLGSRERDRSAAALAQAEADRARYEETLDATRRAEAIHQGVRSGGYHDAVDRL